MNSKNIYPFYLLVFAIIFAITSPFMFSDGMFMDGLLYARISNNLAHGIGSFWHLQYSNDFTALLEGQPPLAFGIQSLFFKLFGDSILVEKTYSLFTFLITGFLIYQIWKRIKGEEAFQTAWLPILMWGLIPLVFWAIPNNMLENTMMVFTILSVYLILKSYDNKRIFYLFLSGLSISCAFLTKGFTGIFPLSFIFWLWLFKRNISFKRCLIDTSLFILFALLPFALIFLFYAEAQNALEAYFRVQVIGSLESAQTVESRFYILKRLFEELIPVLIISLIIYLISYKQKIENKNIKWGLLFLALGLSGVIPMMVSLKQSGFYMLCAFPFFSIAFACFIEARLSYLMKKINEKAKGFKCFCGISIILFSLSIGLLIYHSSKIGRDKDQLEDVFSVSEIVAQGETISIDPNLREEWSLRDYFGRYFNIVLDTKEPYSKYLLLGKQSAFDIPPEYKKESVKLNLYELYTCP